MKKKERGLGGLTFSLVTDVAQFAWRLFRSPRVPVASKAVLAGLAVYLVSPIDIIPDGIPVLGLMDDAVIAATVLGMAVKWIPDDVIAELWQSDVSFDEAVGILKRSVRSVTRRGKRPA